MLKNLDAMGIEPLFPKAYVQQDLGQALCERIERE